MDMKHFSKYLQLLVLSSVFINSHALASDSNVTFQAGDNSLATKICVAAAQNDLSTTMKRIDLVLPGSKVSDNKKAKLVTRNNRCNGMNIVAFTAKYQANDTFDYLNKRSVKKYQMNTQITDLAHIKVPQLIVVTSK
ncbi:MAG: hypothetical protein P8H39_06545 [Thalassotalea sp.]|nr:hypothetical protein [Thalassotalea sp.]